MSPFFTGWTDHGDVVATPNHVGTPALGPNVLFGGNATTWLVTHFQIGCSCLQNQRHRVFTTYVHTHTHIYIYLLNNYISTYIIYILYSRGCPNANCIFEHVSKQLRWDPMRLLTRLCPEYVLAVPLAISRQRYNDLCAKNGNRNKHLIPNTNGKLIKQVSNINVTIVDCENINNIQQ